MNTRRKLGGTLASGLVLLALVLGLAAPSSSASAITVSANVLVDNLSASWDAPGGGGVYSAYRAAGTDTLVSPGATALYDGREAGIIKAGLSKVLDPLDWDEGLFGFKPAATINFLAAGTLTYDVENQYGTSPVWMTIEIDTGVAGDRSDNTTYQFVPTTNPAGWHTVDAAAGQWQQWADNNGTVTGPLMPLADVVTANDGLNVVRAYLRLGMGDSYAPTSNGTVGWVDKATIAGVTYDFVLRTYWYVAPTGLDTNEGTLASPFLTIQRALDATLWDDTVHVAAGTYPERLTINKPLTLSGAGIGLSIIDATAFSAAGNVIDITGLTGNTKIEGFDIKTGDHSNGIHSAGGTDAAGKIEILNNHIISTYFGDDQFGIIAGYGDLRQLIVTGNEISNTYSNSILAELQKGATEISGNTFNGGFPSVFFMTYDGQNVTTTQKVTGNTFNMSGAEAASGVAGVGVNPSTYYVTTARRTGKYSSFEISGNTFTGLSDVSVKAISVGENSLDGAAGGIDSLSIFGNTISGTDGKGIQLFGHITGAEIHDNVLTGLFQGIKAFSYESTFYPEGNNIYHNQVTGATDLLVYWTGTGTFNVEQNWWGSSAGPTSTKMSANVDYTPWCADPACTSLLPFKYDDTDLGWTHGAAWMQVPVAGTYKDTLHLGLLAGGTMSFDFIGASGSRLVLTYVNYPGAGQIGVHLDGGVAPLITLSTGGVPGLATYTTGPLSAGAHTVTLVPSGGFVAIDSLEVTVPTYLGAGRYDDGDAGWAYSAGWMPFVALGAYDNTLHVGTTPGNTATFLFDGSRFGLTYVTLPILGSFDIYVDGSATPIYTVNSNGPVGLSGYLSPTLAAGPHSVVIKHAGPVGTFIALDEILILP